MRMAKSFINGDWLGYFRMSGGEMIDCWRRVDRREYVMFEGIRMLRLHFSDWHSPSSLLTTDDSLYPHSSNSYKPL